MAVFILRDTDRGAGATGYQQGDVIAVAEDTDNITMPPVLTAPYWVVKLGGITATEAQQYMIDGSSTRKTWQFRTNRMTQDQQSYLIARRHLGFGDEVVKYGQEVADDIVVPWTTGRDWLVNKVTGRTAGNQRV